MRSNQIEQIKSAVRITPRQRSVIVGTLLGDGHLETQNNGRTYRLKIEHSIVQKEYVDQLFQELKPLVRTAPHVKKREGNDSYWFTTYSLGQLRFYGQQFYPKKKKIVPKIVNRFLDPLALAVWFMDDGSYKSQRHSTFIFHTLGYQKKELERVVDVLKKKFGIVTCLHRQKSKWRLYIKSDSAQKFVDVVRPHIIPSMEYKLGKHIA